MITVDEARGLAEKHNFTLISNNNFPGIGKKGCIVDLLLFDKGYNLGYILGWYFTEASKFLNLSEGDVAQLSYGFENIREVQDSWTYVPDEWIPNPDHPNWQAGYAIREALATII